MHRALVHVAAGRRAKPTRRRSIACVRRFGCTSRPEQNCFEIRTFGVWKSRSDLRTNWRECFNWEAIRDDATDVIL